MGPIDIKVYKIIKDYLTEEEIKTFFKTTELNLIVTKRNREYFPWTEAEVNQLGEELSRLLSFQEIAKLHERSVGGIEAQYRKLTSVERDMTEVNKLLMSLKEDKPVKKPKVNKTLEGIYDD